MNSLRRLVTLWHCLLAVLLLGTLNHVLGSPTVYRIWHAAVNEARFPAECVAPWPQALASGLFVLGTVLILVHVVSTHRSLRRDFALLRRMIHQVATTETEVRAEKFAFSEAQACVEDLAHLGARHVAQKAQLSQDASRDALTGLANRRVFDLTLSREIAIAHRTGWPLSLVMVDIDHFKRFNDEYGHCAGDQVLQRTAHRLSSLVRESDLVGRFGGEEFAILLPGTPLEDATQIAWQLRDALRCDAVSLDSEEVRVTASFGVGELFECHATDNEELLHLADTAMYSAKQQGRDTVVAAPRDPSVCAVAGTIRPRASNSTAHLDADSTVDRDALALMGSMFSVLQLTPDRDRVCQDVVQQVAAVIDCTTVTASTFSSAQQELIPVATWTKTAGIAASPMDVTPDCAAWVEQMVNQAAAMDERRLEPHTSALRVGEEDLAAFRFPMINNGRMVGIIEAVGEPEQFEITDRQHTVLSALTAIGAAGLRICDAFEYEEGKWIDLLEVLCRAFSSRDAYKRHHAERVSRIAVILCRALGQQDREELQLARVAGLVHDIGKIGLPQRLFEKKGRFRDKDRLLLQEHCRMGDEMLRTLPGMERLAHIVRCHHEHYDGTGYPNRLAADEIPIESRVIAVADAYDAMRSDRPFRAALSHLEALERIRQGLGTQFDPAVVTAFLTVFGPEQRANLLLQANSQTLSNWASRPTITDDQDGAELVAPEVG